MKRSEITFYGLIAIALAFAFFLNNRMSYAVEMEPPQNYIERLAAGETPGWLPPSIEELTQGKVKVGDLITKDNVDLVKEYLTMGVYECVKNKGMVLRMAENFPPDKLCPKFQWEFTMANKGKAVMDQNGTVRLPDGSNWSGGLPFPDPKTPLEAMVNQKFGYPTDMSVFPQSAMLYISKEGKIEKSSKMKIWQTFAFGRKRIPPLGTVPGHENYQWRNINGFVDPLEMKGMGQLNIRHYDEYKDPDEGFMYLPAFKRVIRISATTYQDNMGGSDITYGDPSGLREPYAFWDFKTMTKKLILMPEDKLQVPFINEDSTLNSKAPFDHGYSFPRLGWSVVPAIVIEATPKIKHVYGKRVIYMTNPPYWASVNPIVLEDIYDRQLKFWKSYSTFRDTYTKDGETWGMVDSGLIMYDMQVGHATINPWVLIPNEGLPIEELSLTKLLSLGK
jgi:hypothetical protein